MSALNILISSTRQWNPGDEFILFGVQNILQEAIKKPINWVLYDRNPDLFINGWDQPTHKGKFWSNAFACQDFAGFDLAVVAGTSEWFGKPLNKFYELVREYEIPLVVLGAGYYSDNPIDFSEGEIYCLRDLAKVVTVRDSYASKALSPIGISHALLPCPALFATSEQQCPTSLKKIGFILQCDKTLNHRIPTDLMEAGYEAAVKAHKAGFEVEIVCFYIDELVEFSSRQILPVKYSYNSADNINMLKDYDAIVTTRLHGAIVANSLGKPAILFNKDPRCEGAAELFPFIFKSAPESIIDKLGEIDIKAVAKELPKWKSATKQKYINLLGEINMADEESSLQIRRLRLKMHNVLQAKDAQINDLTNTLQAKDAQIVELNNTIQAKYAWLQQIQRGIVTQLVNLYQKVVKKLLRPGTRRRYYYELGLTGIRVTLNEGWGSFWSKFKQWQRQRWTVRKRSKIHRLAPPSISDDWSDYWVLSQKITEAKRKKLESFSPKPPVMLSINKKELVAHAKSLRFPAVQNPQVSIIIPVYNNDKLTIECLASLLRHTKDIAYEVIVIDDGSSEKTDEVLSQIKNITYLRNPENLGFLLSCNRAAEKARGKFLLILNNDVQFAQGWLHPLVETFSKYENVGAVGPKILYPNGRLQGSGARIKQNAYSQLIGLGDDPGQPMYSYTREVDYCSAVCLVVETEVFRKLGGFDSSLAPAFGEDIDLCFRLRNQGRRIIYNPKSVIIHHLNSTAGDIVTDCEMQCVVQNQQKISERWQEQIDNLNRVRLIAFYLPQFHPIPENDRWWGKGFTDWTNVTKAQPNFAGHYQPHMPSDLGYYDLRNEEVMQQQAELAKRYGICGFCFYYYWFNGKRLLEMPLERMLKTGKPDIPFCLCWANDNWTRKWIHGSEHEILIAQQHSDDDDHAVISDLMRYMRHPNYIRINDKPLLLVYRADLFPNMKWTTEIWRDLCHKEGVGEIYLAMVESFEPFLHDIEHTHPSKYGFDASVECPPHLMFAPIKLPGELLNPSYSGVVHDYREVVLRFVQKEIPGYTRFRTVSPSWDDTPRRQDNSNILVYSTPGAYQAWLETVINSTMEQNFGDERIVFINAWNEWAEGMYLEPDQRFGHGFLEATHNALECSLLKTHEQCTVSRFSFGTGRPKEDS